MKTLIYNKTRLDKFENLNKKEMLQVKGGDNFGRHRNMMVAKEKDIWEPEDK